MDESHCSFHHKPTKVLANCTFQNTPGRVSDSREGTTFITHACANGTYFPPLIIVKGKTPNSLLGFNTQDGPKGAIWTYQEKTWTENILGIEWFQFFYKHIEPKPTKDAPHLLVVDSHGTHETSGLISAAREESVNIFSLPGHKTHWLQPLDRSIFKPFKTAYDKMCSEHLQNTENVISKVTWPGLFWHAFEEAMIPPSIFSGFAATGIYPWSPLAIPICTLLSHKAFQEGSISIPTKRHPLAWVMDKVAEVEATIILDAADNNVMSLLRSSMNTSSPPTETPILQQNLGENSGVSVQNQQESIVEDDGSQNKTPEDQISPIIPLESGITLGNLNGGPDGSSGAGTRQVKYY